MLPDAVPNTKVTSSVKFFARLGSRIETGLPMVGEAVRISGVTGSGTFRVIFFVLDPILAEPL